MSFRPRPLSALRPLRHPVGRALHHLPEHTRSSSCSCAISRGELREIGLADADVDAFGYVTATIPATAAGPHIPTIGFIAHVDTSPEISGVDVKPIVHRAYDGRDLVLPDDPSAVLRLADNPPLAEQMGHDIVTASGTTLLGADNKAGVAEIVTAADFLLRHPEIPAWHAPHRLHAGRRSGAGHGALRRRALRRRLRLHDGRRLPRRGGKRELLGRCHDRHLRRIQHAPRIREGAHGQLDQGGRRLHQPAARQTASHPRRRKATKGSCIPTSCTRASSGRR